MQNYEEIYEIMTSKELDIVERADIKDLFFYIALKVIRSNDWKKARDLVALFEDVESFANKKNNKEVSTFFFVLSQMLSVNFKIKTISETENISLNSFKESIKKLLRKIKNKTLEELYLYVVNERKEKRT